MRVMALDIGERRIGVAISDPTGTVARPLCTIHRVSRARDQAAIAELIAEHQVELVVVGQPLTLRGEVGPQAQRVEKDVQSLAEALPVPIALCDERYTTVAAEEIIQQRGHSKRRGRDAADIDAVAAAFILQAFLDGGGEPRWST